ncbi:MAG: hypothetical protein H6810_10425 [Phycisphaeraceae bacterium]|nr:MAG: hypothetical protein H6810_10425 [Phycisphaeraceae bacterium]
MAGPQPYSVSSPRGVCAVTGNPISAGEPCVSLLVEHEGDEGLDRLDVALDAWDSGRRPEHAGATIATWHTVIPEKDKPRQQLIGDGEVLDLFEQLAEAEDPRQLAFRYLLALILIRKRQLAWEGATPAARGVPGSISVRRRGEKDAPPMEVVDPGLDDDAIDAATEQIAMVMNLDEQDT